MTDQDVFAFKPLAASTFVVASVSQHVALLKRARQSFHICINIVKRLSHQITLRLPVLSPVVDFVMTVWKRHMRDECSD